MPDIEAKKMFAAMFDAIDNDCDLGYVGGMAIRWSDGDLIACVEIYGSNTVFRIEEGGTDVTIARNGNDVLALITAAKTLCQEESESE